MIVPWLLISTTIVENVEADGGVAGPLMTPSLLMVVWPNSLEEIWIAAVKKAVVVMSPVFAIIALPSWTEMAPKKEPPARMPLFVTALESPAWKVTPDRSPEIDPGIDQSVERSRNRGRRRRNRQRSSRY